MKEKCPKCGCTEVREKLILIDTAWVDFPGRDPREKCGMGLRADQVREEFLGEPPLEQFIKGYICIKCEQGYVLETILKEGYFSCGHHM